MLIECPNCHTKFKVKDELIPETGRKVKCSKCKYIFNVKREKEKKPEEIEEVFNLTEETSQKESSEKPPTPRKQEEEEDEKLEKELEAIAKKYKKPSLKKQKKVKEKPQRSLYLITLAMLIIAILFSASFLYFKTKNSRPPFTFIKLKGNYYENKKYGEILVIQGELKNNTKKTYTNVKIKVTIFDTQGNKIKEATTYIGNIFSEDELLNLTKDELSSLIYNQVVLKPLAEIPFMVVIYDPPKISYSFQAEVIDYKIIKR